MQVLRGDSSLPNETDKKLRSIVDDINRVLKSVSFEDDKEKRIKGQDKSVHVKKQTETNTPFPGISRLTPTLFLCGAAAVVPEHLVKLGVRLVVNVAPELPDTPLPSVNPPLYLRVNAQDRSEVNLASHFDEVADLIEEVALNGGCSLVHCVAGVSRSASLCLAYLMKHRAMSLRDAFHLTKAARPQVRPNSGFFQQLRRYENQLHGTCSVQMVYFASLDKEIPDILEPEYRAMEDFYQRYRNPTKKR